MGPTAAAATEFAPVRPSGAVLHTTQNRLREKGFLAVHGFPVAPFAAVRSPADLAGALVSIGLPAVLKTAGHNPPVNAVTVACGIGSAIAAFVGGISTCLTGPTNAIIVGSGERERHYIAGIVVGLLAVLFGLFAPTFTRLLLSAPKTFVAALAGLAMLRVLQAAFVASFATRFSLGALAAFLVTVADVPLLNVGAAFWGLIAGLIVSGLLERADFAAEKKS